MSEVGSKKFDFAINSNTLKIPYYANKSSLNDQNTVVTRAVIALHGVNRNAYDYYDNMLAAANMQTTNLDTLLIVAPQFLREKDLTAHSLDNEHLYWSNEGWKIGNLSKNESTHPRPVRISSFAVMDSLLLNIANNFTKLKTIVLTGHSAGGQYINRYSASSPVVESLNNKGIGIRFIVNNPSSYLYLDDKRRIAGTVDQFEVSTSACTNYNSYKYGLDNLPSYLSQISETVIRDRLKTREVVYLLGQFDNNFNDTSLDKSCEALLQGLHRLERGTVYFNYLKNYYGSSIEDMQTIETVPNVGHSHQGMFQSQLGRHYTFTKSHINTTTLSDDSVENTLNTVLIYPNPTRKKLNISFSLIDTELKMYDAQSRLVFNKKIKNEQKEIELPSLEDGVYFLLFDKEGKKASKKIIIAN